MTVSPKIVLDFEHRTIAHINSHKSPWKKKAEADRDKHAMHAWWVRLGKPIPLFPCEVTFIRIAPRSLDDDNLLSAFKFIRDELCRCWGRTIVRGRQVQARDDAGGEISWKYGQEKPPRPGYYGVRIEIR